MVEVKRNFNVKAVDMLISSSTITDSAISHQRFLQTKRPGWTMPFFELLKSDINNVIQTHLGVDNAKQLRQATAAVKNIYSDAIRDLAEAKVQIIDDFKKDKVKSEELLKQLGFTTYHTAAQRGDQEALVNFLHQFKKNCTPPVQTEITAAGMSGTTLTNIIGYADTLTAANVSQEGYKGERAVLSAAAIIAFNDIHSRVIGICKIASKFFKDQPQIKGQFSFSKVSTALNKHPAKGSKETPTPPTA